eukprot:CAMPEP_0185177900 /NCGR_PEP_ID=MMETSP1139-20130426/30395_2 /TAXON_ID=298111 /ORGANISM="Pavlova sp., Strain CCMP459" /LENGTH=157 /DNA_ID=CAMNT_0027743703 /DNA_START=421 /DNA_END=891 /DNA_ORIENTATION=-
MSQHKGLRRWLPFTPGPMQPRAVFLPRAGEHLLEVLVNRKLNGNVCESQGACSQAAVESGNALFAKDLASHTHHAARTLLAVHGLRLQARPHHPKRVCRHVDGKSRGARSCHVHHCITAAQAKHKGSFSFEVVVEGKVERPEHRHRQHGRHEPAVPP